ncbi:MAG: hypothetical protein C0391_03290 [Anaerolinea sp.]|nr:hypothetical protein [Anaerolinea sp.]
MLFSMILLAGCLPSNQVPGIELLDTSQIPYFMDDFSDHSNGWNLATRQEGVAEYDGDSLRLYIIGTNREIITTPGIKLKNASVDADAQRVTGPENNIYGLVCRYAGPENYYGFLISSDGYYAIVKNINGQRTILNSDSFEPSEFIQKGGGINHLRILCSGRTLSLYVNDQLMEEVQDIDLVYGGVGMLAATLEEPGTDVRFDNFIVMNLE